jgi:hypothetical protein
MVTDTDNANTEPRETKREPAVHVESLEEEARFTIEESRMVLPGIQALFGFQLVAMFNQRFAELSTFQQRMHLAALLLVALSIGLVMAPAAYHRLAERGQISRHFIELASSLIATAMLPLMMGLVIEIAVVSLMVIESLLASQTIAACTALFFAWIWFVFPWRNRYRGPLGARG